MGKRSAFERVPKDLYSTPARAAAPLLQCLKPRTRFIEPCYGKGALAGHLKRAGHVLVAAHDRQDDARSFDYAVRPGELFITNPPYWGQGKDLHRLILNLSDQAPTWLLMSADWLFNQSSGPLTCRLSQIVAVGRVKWIPGSKHVGKDNAAWLLFNDGKQNAPFFVGREPPATRKTDGP